MRYGQGGCQRTTSKTSTKQPSQRRNGRCQTSELSSHMAGITREQQAMRRGNVNLRTSRWTLGGKSLSSKMTLINQARQNCPQKCGSSMWKSRPGGKLNKDPGSKQ